MWSTSSAKSAPTSQNVDWAQLAKQWANQREEGSSIQHQLPPPPGPPPRFHEPPPNFPPNFEWARPPPPPPSYPPPSFMGQHPVHDAYPQPDFVSNDSGGGGGFLPRFQLPPPPGPPPGPPPRFHEPPPNFYQPAPRHPSEMMDYDLGNGNGGQLFPSAVHPSHLPPPPLPHQFVPNHQYSEQSFHVQEQPLHLPPIVSSNSAPITHHFGYQSEPPPQLPPPLMTSYPPPMPEIDQTGDFGAPLMTTAGGRKLPSWLKTEIEEMQVKKAREANRAEFERQRDVYRQQNLEKLLGETPLASKFDEEDMDSEKAVSASVSDSESRGDNSRLYPPSEPEEEEVEPEKEEDIHPVKRQSRFENIHDSPEKSKVETPPPPQIDRQQELMAKIRNWMTDILLQVTNDEIALVAGEVHDRAKQKLTASSNRPVVQLVRSTTNSAANRLRKTSVLVEYESDDDDDNKSDDQKDQKQNTDKNPNSESELDSDEELQRAIEAKLAAWPKKAVRYNAEAAKHKQKTAEGIELPPSPPPPQPSRPKEIAKGQTSSASPRSISHDSSSKKSEKNKKNKKHSHDRSSRSSSRDRNKKRDSREIDNRRDTKEKERSQRHRRSRTRSRSPARKSSDNKKDYNNNIDKDNKSNSSSNNGSKKADDSSKHHEPSSSSSHHRSHHR